MEFFVNCALGHYATRSADFTSELNQTQLFCHAVLDQQKSFLVIMLQDIPKQQKEDEELHLKMIYENILNSTDLP